MWARCHAIFNAGKAKLISEKESEGWVFVATKAWWVWWWAQSDCPGAKEVGDGTIYGVGKTKDDMKKRANKLFELHGYPRAFKLRGE